MSLNLLTYLSGQRVLAEYISLSLLQNFPISSDSPRAGNQYCCEFLRNTMSSNNTKIARIGFLWSGHFLNICSVLLCCIYQFLFFFLRSFTRWNKSSFCSWTTRNVQPNSKMHLSSQHFISVI